MDYGSVSVWALMPLLMQEKQKLYKYDVCAYIDTH